MTKFFLTRFSQDENGSTSTEYGLVATLIGIALLGVIMSLGDGVETHYEAVNTEYAAAANNSAE